MYADPAGNVLSPAVEISWTDVLSVATTVDKCCVEGKHSGGVWIISGILLSLHPKAHNSLINGARLIAILFGDLTFHKISSGVQCFQSTSTRQAHRLKA